MVPVRLTISKRGRAVPAAILAAALATAAAACSSSSSSNTAATSATGSAASSSASPAGTTTVTGAAAATLISKAIANTKAAPSIVVVGSGVSAGSSSSGQVSFNLTLVQKAGCKGTIAASKTETFQLVETGGYVWLKPSAGYYASLHITKEALALLGDKYIKVPSDNSQLADLTKLCSFSGLFGELKTPTGTSYVATPTTYQGQNAYKVTQTGQAGYAYITNSATPVLAKLAEPTADGGVITFAEYSEALEITAPSAAESVDGSALGLLRDNSKKSRPARGAEAGVSMTHVQSAGEHAR